MSKTPYSEEISALATFFQEVKESEISKKGIRSFANGTVKSTILPRHIEETARASSEEFARERHITNNLQHIQSQAQDLEMSSNQFIDGEEAYQRLLKAKKMESLATLTESKNQTSLQLNSALHDIYLREIVEQGGAPSVQELSIKAEILGGQGYLEESLTKRTINYVTEVVSVKLGDPDLSTKDSLIIDPRREAVLNA